MTAPLSQREVEVYQLGISHWDNTPLPKLRVLTVHVWQQEFAKFLRVLSQTLFQIKTGKEQAAAQSTQRLLPLPGQVITYCQ